MAFFLNNAPDWQKIASEINRSGTVYISTHINPDGDAIGSEVALAYYLKKINKTEKWVKKVIDYLNERDGSYYLPYMHFATKEQFQKAYPQWRYVAVKKDQYDPDHLFVNGLYKDYVLPNVREKLGKGQQAEDLTA